MLRSSGLVTTVQEVVAGVGRANAARFDPRTAGDTAKLFGMMCSENVAQLVHRRLHGGLSTPPEGVTASLVEHTLILHAAGLRIGARKAPDDGPPPEWDAMTWEESGGRLRHAGAAANTLAYSAVEQDLRQQAFDFGTGSAPARDPSALRYAVLVYTVHPDTGVTSGWLGFPCLGRPTFFAATGLWGCSGRPP